MRKNLKITEEAHNIIKEYCRVNHLKISDWASSVLLKQIEESMNGNNAPDQLDKN
jgi:hypothetical protein